jgi:hypothetical protein
VYDDPDLEATYRQAMAVAYDLVPTLQPKEQEMVLHETWIGIQRTPDGHQLQATRTPAGATLLGLMEYPPGKITLFHDTIQRGHSDIRDVTLHEIGHRLTYDHSRRSAVVSLVDGGQGMLCDGCALGAGGPNCGKCKPAQSARAILARFQRNDEQMVMAQQAPWFSDNCPVCNLWDRLVVADGLLTNTSTETSLQHLIPAGLGGTIPLARYRVRQAYDLYPQVAGMVDATTGMTVQLRNSLNAARQALGPDGTILTPDQLRVAAQAVHIAQLQAFQTVWAYYAPQYT